MNLYHVQFDSQTYYVEAGSFADAIILWGRHVSVLWGDDYDGTEEPESVALVHDEPVIRDGSIDPHQADEAAGTGDRT